MANTVRCFHSRSLGLDILARRRHHGNCSAFRSLELGPNHRPLQAALSGSLIKAPGFAGGYLLLEQVKKALEAAGSDLDHVLKCNVMCISADRFKAFNEVYKRYFPKNPPARIFFCVPEWTGPFDVEVDCVAVTKD